MIKSLGHCHLDVCFRLEDIRSQNVKKNDYIQLIGVILIKRKQCMQLAPFWWYKDQGDEQSDTGHF